MRHVPTSVYIDTEFYKRQSFRFDTKSLKSLITNFKKGGLRLLVPAISERELIRHFSNEAKTVSNSFTSAQKAYPVSKILHDLPSKEELEGKCFEELMRQWSSFKEHFAVEQLPLVGNLEDVVSWYFAVQPPFSGAKKKEFPDAFILSVLDQYHKHHHAKIAVISNDGDFAKACMSRSYILHFADLDKYIEAFLPELSGKERLPDDIDPTIPIATEDLTELKAILARGGNVTSIEVDRVLLLLKSRGTNYDYFFQSAKDIFWLKPLSERGYFLNPPNIEIGAEGRYIVPWPPMDYLVRVFECAKDNVVEIVLALPTTNNFRVLEGILEILLKADYPEVLVSGSRYIVAFIENYNWGHELIIRLLNKKFIFDSKLSEVTPALILKIVEFREDPIEQKTRANIAENIGYSLLQPNPRFSQWGYQEILEKGICPLAKQEPYQVSRLLIDAVASMLRMQMHWKDVENGSTRDMSEIWCRRLDRPDQDYRDSKETLVQTLTYACSQVYENAPESIDALDQALRNQNWDVFMRIRRFLYASYPSDQTLPWIREQILSHQKYGSLEHQNEFQLMIRKASEYFGSKLLEDNEQQWVYNEILSGPSKVDFMEWVGDQYSDEGFIKRKRYFHRIQLRPFFPILRGEFARYYNELDAGSSADVVTDDSYALYGEEEGGIVSYQSPRSAEDLENLKDEEILFLLNDWNDEHRDADNWLVEVNIYGLAQAFQALFKDKISSDQKRLSFWLTNCAQITRPIYVASMLNAIVDLVKERRLDNFSHWLELSNWVLSRLESRREEGGPEPRDESRDQPDWGSSRRAVVDLIDACLKLDADFPIEERAGLGTLLRQICCQPDVRLDYDQELPVKNDDPITTAINVTRTRALETLVNFGFWIRRQLADDQIPELTDILSERISVDSKIPLTRPEYAILGMHFGDLCSLNFEWTTQHCRIIFPRGIKEVWLDAFGSYIRFNNPKTLLFDTLRGEFEFAIENLILFESLTNKGLELTDRLGQHLFTYYLWGVYPLTSSGSLLDNFYEKTDTDRELWGRLFDQVGRSLRKTGSELDEVLIERIIAFFDWRFNTAELLELQKFTYWLGAECLSPEWRLKSYSKILDLGQIIDFDLSLQVNALNKLLPNCQALVVECFAKITDAMAQSNHTHISVRETAPIISAGLAAEDQQVRENAERARENLLRLGKFEYLDH